MRYVLFTYTGDGLPIAARLQSEGRHVAVGMVADSSDIHADGEQVPVEDERERARRLSLFDGILEKIPARELCDKIEREDTRDLFVLFDRNHLFRFAERLAPLGIKGNFPTEEDYRLEVERDRAKEMVRRDYPKLEVAEVREFGRLDEVRGFLESTDQIWVVKGRSDEAPTFIPDVDDPALAGKQLLQQIETDREAYERAGFILEPMIRNVVELTPEQIFYDGELIATTLDIENKPFGCGNVSIQTGCAQDLVFPIPSTDRICEVAFPPIVQELARRRRGLFYWDASLLIDRRTRKIYFGEFCSNRPGFNSLFSELAQCRSVHDYFSSIAQGKNPFTLGTVGCSVTLFNPSRDAGQRPAPGTPIEYKKHVAGNFWPWDARQENGRLVSAGKDWNLGVMTGKGRSIEEAVREMYRAVDDFSFVGVYYRPKFDFLSLDYPTSILNRLNYGLDRGLYQLPFNVKVGDLL